MKKLLVFIGMMLLLLSACTLTENENAQRAEGKTIGEEGHYSIEVMLTGGSGKTTIASPTKLVFENETATATVTWSSTHYDYMLVNGVKYMPVSREGNAVFEIPVTLDADMTVIADTTAMSTPHEISYTLHFDSATMKPLKDDLSIVEKMTTALTDSSVLSGELNRSLGNGWQPERSMPILYAKNFSVDYYSGGCTLIAIADGSRYLMVPDGGTAPEGIDSDITVLNPPVQNIYLVATSAMCLFDDLGALDNIRLSGTKAEDWYIPNAKAKMQAGEILYAGKYRAPDYELILTNNCSLAIESTMINHNPEVKEKLEALGIPVLVEQSSYETHPLGRTEWMKLYGVLTGKEIAAEQCFSEQVAYVNEVANLANTGQTVAYFYINSAGDAVTRKAGDYVAKMIELAGGKYIFENLGDSDNATSTVNLEMEAFYAAAKEADFIIYNSTIGGEVTSMDELLRKNSLLREFKAVKNGNVWCTDENLFQETTQLGLMISDMHRMLTESDTNLTTLNFMYKLQ
jgi:iron complex transport system substrate-binding protein